LSASTSENVGKIDATLSRAGIASSSFDADQPNVEHLEEAKFAWAAVVNATHEFTVGASGVLSTYGFPQMMKFRSLAVHLPLQTL
jgi:hypothetical protein